MQLTVLALAFLAAGAAKAPAKKQPARPAPVEQAPADIESPSMVHAPVREAPFGQPLRFEVEITDASGVFEPTVNWRMAGTEEWQRMPLEPMAYDRFSAELNGRRVLADIEYFVEAYDKVGNGPGRTGSPTKPFLVKVSGAPVPGAAVEATPPPRGDIVEGRSLLGPALTAGASVVLAVVGGVLWMGASSDADELNRKYPSKGAAVTTDDHAALSSVKTRGQVGSTLLILGGVGLAGGGAWLLFAPAPMALIRGEF